MRKQKGNYAFIDSQNLHLGVKSQGWSLDFARFRVYLRHKYRVEKAFACIGYVEGNQLLYKELQEAVIISGDGDFHCLIEHLLKHQKLCKVIVPNKLSILACGGINYKKRLAFAVGRNLRLVQSS